MARSFSTGNYIHRMSPADWSQQGAIAFWFKPTWSSNPGAGTDANHQLLQLYNASPLALFDFQRVAANGSIYVGWYSGGVDARTVTSDSGLFSAGVWAHHIVEWAATGQPFGPFVIWYVDGVQKAIITSPGYTVPTSLSEWQVGEGPSSSIGADGDIAEFGRWSAPLTPTQRADLVAGWRPSATIDSLNANLVEYIPILGNNSPEPELIAGADLTLVGTPAQATHPPLLGSDQTIDPSTIAATATIPSPAVDMILGISPVAISATAAIPTPVLTMGALGISPSSIAAVAAIPSPGVNFLIPKGLTVTVSDRLAAG